MQASERYRLVEPLGRGAMGEVWQAEDTALRREVAVKVLLDQPTVAGAVERFHREAQTAARLNHPNVVAVYDFDEVDGRLRMVMELVPGKSLRDELTARGRLGIEEACRIAGQAATGLAAAHDQGVVHRDVKPGNLLLTDDRVVKVADFGIARAAAESASSLTTTGSVLGTTAYLAPERGTGSDAVPASDVYALGCVLYEMLCGQTPFTGDPAAVVYQHVDVSPRPPVELRPELPGAVSDFVRRMLAKDPSERPTAAQAAAFLAEYGTDGSGRELAGFPAQADAGEAPRAADATAHSTAAHSTAALPPVREERRPRRKATVPVVVALLTVFLAAALAGSQLDFGAGGQDARPSAPTESPSPRHSTPPAHDKPAPRAPSGPAKDRPAPEKKKQDKLEEQARKAIEKKRKQREKAAEKAGPEAGKAAEERRKQREDAPKKR